MPVETLPEDILGAVSPDDAIAYASGTGWQRVEGDDDIALFSHPTQKFVQVLLPLTNEYDDYAYSIAKALSRFAQVEKRSQSQILNELLLPKSDILRFQISGPNSAKGLLQVDEGVNLYNGVRSSLLAAACGVLKPAKYYVKLARRAADDFLKTCWLGQTERSSYVATVSCPMGIAKERDKDNTPFTRQATGLLINTMDAVAKAIDAHEEDKLLDLQDANIVVSANLCEAIVAMQPKEEKSTLNVRCSWAKALPPQPGMFPDVVSFKSSQVETLSRIAEELRPKVIEDRERDYIGTIEALRSEPNIADRTLGEVIVMIADAGGTPRHVRVELAPKEYAIACNAHRDGNAVLIRGVLRHGIRLHRIESPTMFSLIPKS